MIICKRLVPLDDTLQEANPNNNNNNNKNDPGDGGHQGDRGEGTEGGEEGKEEGGERGEEGGEEILAGRQADGPIKGSTRGPRGPKMGTHLFLLLLHYLHHRLCLRVCKIKTSETFVCLF